VLYNYAWFVGFAVSFVAYLGLMKVNQPQPLAQAAD
jgi:cytosine/uracil/thiamine/allantoin permease